MAEAEWYKEEKSKKAEKGLKKAGSTVMKKVASVSSEDARERSRVYRMAEIELKDLRKEKYQELKNK